MRPLILPKVKNPDLMPFNYRILGDEVLLSNDAGYHTWLSKEEFGDFVGGTLPSDSPAMERLRAAYMARDEHTELAAMEKINRRSGHIFEGTSLHIVILTLRCNQSCVYCHANRMPKGAKGFDMSMETAEKTLDVIFESPAQELTIEFQGGEPALNFAVLRYMVEQGYSKADKTGKTVYFSLVSNLSALSGDDVDFLVDNGVMVCSSLDGPKELHDKNRHFGKMSSYDSTMETIASFKEAYDNRSYDISLAYVNVLATISKSSLSKPKEIVDEYIRLGHKVLHLRPLNPFGMGEKIWAKEGYGAEEFLKFWYSAMDYMIQLNKKGIEIMEKMASIMLTKILSDKDPNYMDLRSPCGAGIGQLAYNHDGKVYTCDEGRMVGAMGDDIFQVGDVAKDGYHDIIHHPGVRSLCVASCLECLPGCSQCAYAPYCGVCPVYNYVVQGDLVARMPENDRCKIQMGMLDYLFLKLRDPEINKLLSRWIETRDRSSVYQRIL